MAIRSPIRRVSAPAIALAVALLSGCAGAPRAPAPPAPAAAPATIGVPAPAPAKIEASAQKMQLRFAVAGDIMAHESQLRAAYDKQCDCYDFKPVFAPAAPLFRDVDVAIANLETTLPGKNYSGYPAFGAPDSLVDAATAAGITLFTTANNHCLDKGRDGLLRTLQVLDAKGIPHLGTYASAQDYENHRVFMLNKNGISVALLDYTYGTNGIPTPDGVVVNRISKAQIGSDVALARAQHPDAVIVLFHFGQEYLNKPDAFQREMVLQALSSGADIVLGGHPHRVQPYQMMHDGGPGKTHLVAYSLGNFVSAQRQRYSDGGMVLYFTLVKQQDATGRTTLDVTDVHHKLVWVYVAHEDSRREFRILPVEATLAAPDALPASALENMKRFRSDADAVLGVREGQVLQ